MKSTGTPADASTLIYLAKADVFAPAGKCAGRLLVTPSVWREAVEAGTHRGAVEVAHIRLAEGHRLLSRVELAKRVARRARDIAHQYTLGSGESEVLAVAEPGGRALVDEGRATRVAESLGLVPVSTLLLPAIGAAEGKLEGTAAMELLHRLASVTGARADVIVRLERIIRGQTR